MSFRTLTSGGLPLRGGALCAWQAPGLHVCVRGKSVGGQRAFWGVVRVVLLVVYLRSPQTFILVGGSFSDLRSPPPFIVSSLYTYFLHYFP